MPGGYLAMVALAHASFSGVKAKLAGYKAPRRVLTTETIGRSPAGKVDYSRLRKEATQRIGA